MFESLGKVIDLADRYARLEAARDLWKVHRVKQQQNTSENSRQLSVQLF